MNGGFYSTVMLNEEHFGKIEGILKAKLSDKNRLALQRACDSYLIDREATIPRPSRTKKQLENIQNCCESLIEALQEADSLTTWDLDTHHPAAITDIPNRPGLTLEEQENLKDKNTGYFRQIEILLEHLPKDLQIIQKAAANALADLEPDKGYRTPNVALNNLLLTLKKIYENATGKKAARSWSPYDKYPEDSFHCFCKEFLILIGCQSDRHSDAALASSIKRTCI